MTKVLCVSDLHGYLPKIKTPADLLLIGGDICPAYDHSVSFQHCWMKDNFYDWARHLIWDGIVKAIAFVAGNHDFLYEKGGYGLQAREHDPMRPMGGGIPIYYLQDNQRTLCGLKIWGSPWQRRFYDWAFNLDEPELAQKWELIPKDTDILLLHSPPYGVKDLVWNTNNEENWPANESVGSPSLAEWIYINQPKLAVFGHIHSSWGKAWLGNTICVNGSYVGEDYKPRNPIIEVDL